MRVEIKTIKQKQSGVIGLAQYIKRTIRRVYVK